MSKMGLHDPFGHLKHKAWPKEKLRVKSPIWLPTTKNKKLPLFPRIQVTCKWKALNKGYNFALNLISIRGLHTKLWDLKVTKGPTLAISRFPFGSPDTKCHLDVGFVERYIVYYKGEGGGFPQVWAMISLVSLKLSMVHPTPKLCTNQLVVWFVQIRVSD
jgi:hypothetical protein